MIRKMLPLILVLLSGSAAAQQVLFENPYDPAGSGGITISNSDSISGATTFTLSANATIQAVSVIVEDLFGNPMGTYNWSIYADVNGMPGGAPGPISAPTGAPTFLPIVSGTAANMAEPGDSVYSWLNVVPGTVTFNEDAINEVTIDTGAVNLAAGTYFLSLSGQEGVGSEQWLSGISNTGTASSFVGAFTPVSAGGEALTVIGKQQVAAPEIAPSSAIGAMTLLLGSLLVMRGRRSTKLDSATA